MRKERESNIELLRVIAAIGVIILHYNNASIGKALANVVSGSTNERLLLALEALSICAVNVFMLISGYFGCTAQKSSWAKTLCLLLQLILFRVCTNLLDVCYGGNFCLESLARSLLPAAYYVVLYAVTYLLSPYVNILLGKLSGRERRRLVILVVVLFSVWPSGVDLMAVKLKWNLSGLSTIGLYGSQSGYTIVNFLMMYILGACLRMNDVSWKPGKALTIFVSCTLAVYLWSKSYRGTAWAYCNPLVVLQAVSVFLLARNWKIQSRLINSFSAGTYTSYIIHRRFLRFCKIPQAAHLHPVLLLAHVLVCSVCIFLISWVCSLAYNAAEKPLRKWLEKCLGKWNIAPELSITDKECV